MLLRIVIALALVVSLCAPVAAVPATSQVSGVVADASGTPIADVTLRFTPEGGGTTYEGKTNKKGRYSIVGMFNASENDGWKVEISGAGYLPVSMKVESRTVNRILLGDPYTARIKPGGSVPTVPIRPMGMATVDFTMAPEAEVRQAAAQAVQAERAKAGVPEPPKADAWDEALGKVAAGDAEGALPLFEKAIADEPDDVERRTTLAKVLYQLERHDLAAVQAEQAIAQAPDVLEPRMVLAAALVADGERAKARAVLEEARPRFPAEQPRILQQLGSLALEDGDMPAALAAYEALVAADPQNADGWLSLGDLYAQVGQMAKSGQAYEKVAELNPTEAPEVFYNIGALLMSKPGRTEAETRKAITAFRRAIELRPDYAQAQQQLAFALLAANDRAGAKAALESYLRLAPSAPDAAEMQQILRSIK